MDARSLGISKGPRRALKGGAVTRDSALCGGERGWMEWEGRWGDLEVARSSTVVCVVNGLLDLNCGL